MLIKYEYVSTYTRHSSAHEQFHKQFIQNKSDYACKICDTLWFEGNLKNLINDSVEFVRKFLQNVFTSPVLVTGGHISEIPPSSVKSHILEF